MGRGPKKGALQNSLKRSRLLWNDFIRPIGRGKNSGSVCHVLEGRLSSCRVFLEQPR
jgi:hypothetical protein